MEAVAQIFGITFVGIIMICLGWTIVEFIFTGFEEKGKRKKLK
jgi:hypothetical protein